MAATAIYTQTGIISVDDDGTEIPVVTYDADGGEWIAAVDAQLVTSGFVRIGRWDGDRAPVRWEGRSRGAAIESAQHGHHDVQLMTTIEGTWAYCHTCRQTSGHAGEQAPAYAWADTHERTA